MSDETPKDAETETPEVDDAAPEAAAEEEAKPKRRRRSRAKKAAEEAPPAEPVAEEDADAAASKEAAPAKPVAEADDAIEPTPEDIEAADEAASEEDLEDEAASDEDLEDEAASEEDLEDEAAEEPAPARRRRRGRRAAETADEEAPAPRRTRERPAPGERVLVRAQAKYVRTSARKARLVCDHIRGKSVVEARAILAHTPRAVSRDWSKLLESAVANAENNHELLGDDLRIAQVTADEGPTLKRYRPRAMGRATRIRKRTSHLTILLTPKEY
jgi:ribosomal protein L22